MKKYVVITSSLQGINKGDVLSYQDVMRIYDVLNDSIKKNEEELERSNRKSTRFHIDELKALREKFLDAL